MEPQEEEPFMSPSPPWMAAHGNTAVGNGLGDQNPSPVSLQVWGFRKVTESLW